VPRVQEAGTDAGVPFNAGPAIDLHAPPEVELLDPDRTPFPGLGAEVAEDPGGPPDQDQARTPDDNPSDTTVSVDGESAEGAAVDAVDPGDPAGEPAAPEGLESVDQDGGDGEATAKEEAAGGLEEDGQATPVPLTEEELAQRVLELEARLSEVEQASEAQREHAFVKGWLTGVGDVDFTFDKHRFVVGFQMFPIEQSAGGTLTNRTYYLGAVPRVFLHFGKLFLGVELPLAFEIFDTQVDSADPNYVGGAGFANAGEFAGFQWDETSEFAQVIDYIRYGHKEDDLYVNVGKVSAATVGHGTQIRRYNPNIDLDHHHVSAQIDKGFGYAGLEFYTNDIVNYGLTGALGYVKPFRLFYPDNLMLRSLSIGVSYMADRKAPYLLAHDPSNSSYLIADEFYTPRVEDARVASVFGVDTEVKVVKTRQVDVKGYVDYSRLMNTGGDGFSLGSLVRINVGGNADDERIHAFRIRGEVGAYHARYAPGYFDMFYEIEKYQALMNTEGEVVPKLRYLEAQSGGYRLGGRFEATYALVHGPGISAAIQGTSGGRDSQFLLHAELPSGDHLRLMATYVRMNLFDGERVFDMEAPDSLLIGRAKLKVLPFLFVNAEISKMYRLRAVSEGETSESAIPAVGDPAEFRNVIRWVLETEVGFEF